MKLFSLFLMCLVYPNMVLSNDEPLKQVSFDMVSQRAQPSLIKRDGQFLGWLNDGQFIWQTISDETEYFKVEPKTGKREKLSKEALPKGMQRPSSHQTKAGDARVWISQGDLFYSGPIPKNRLTYSSGDEKTPRLSPDGTAIAYTRDHNLFVMDIQTGVEKQLTEDGSDVIKNGYASWVYYEEIFGRPLRYRAFWWSPDSKHIAFMRFDDSEVDLFQIYHLGGVNGYWEDTRYPKAGQKNPKAQIGVVALDSRETVWMELQGDNHSYIAWPFWGPGGENLWVQWMNRGQSNLKVYQCQIEDGKAILRYEESQESWVDFFTDFTLLGDSSFIIRSNKGGFAHLFLYSPEGDFQKQLTSGEWRASRILGVNEERGEVYFMGNYAASTDSQLMSVRLSGTDIKVLTKKSGVHRILFSPGNEYYIDTFSSAQHPAQSWVSSTQGQFKSWQISDTNNPESDSFIKGKVKFFKIPTEDGLQLPAYWILPPDFDDSGAKKYPVIFRIYSGPDGPTVTNRFNTRAGWRDHYYASKGVITISVDHRGSGHFGKKGVSLMHRKLGEWECHDLIQAVKWLNSKPFIDPERMGIIGYSYGGYMTLLAMTKGADYFTHGISGAPVTDWRIYDSVYTERYMDTPEENPQGYEEASILTHAEKLKGPLLLFHGTTDDNVHFQHTLELIGRWTDMAKSFELMVYPESRHGVRQREHLAKSERDFWARHFKLDVEP